jgi:hypothetical protein
VTYDLDRNHLLYKYQFMIGKINIIKEMKRNVCLSHDHHPLNICVSTIESIDRLLLLLKQPPPPPSKCQSDLYCEHTLCKEHDAVDNDEKMIVLSNKKKKKDTTLILLICIS